MTQQEQEQRQQEQEQLLHTAHIDITNNKDSYTILYFGKQRRQQQQQQQQQQVGAAGAATTILEDLEYATITSLDATDYCHCATTLTEEQVQALLEQSIPTTTSSIHELSTNGTMNSYYDNLQITSILIILTDTKEETSFVVKEKKPVQNIVDRMQQQQHRQRQQIPKIVSFYSQKVGMPIGY